MEQIEFPQDFSEFLKLLNDHSVEYLLVGGVGRSVGDLVGIEISLSQ